MAMTLDDFVEWMKDKVNDFQNHYEGEHDSDPAVNPIEREDEQEWCTSFNDYLQEQ